MINLEGSRKQEGTQVAETLPLRFCPGIGWKGYLGRIGPFGLREESMKSGYSNPRVRMLRPFLQYIGSYRSLLKVLCGFGLE